MCEHQEKASQCPLKIPSKLDIDPIFHKIKVEGIPSCFTVVKEDEKSMLEF